MKRCYTHTGYNSLSLSSKNATGSSSDFSIERHTLHRPLSRYNTDTPVFQNCERQSVPVVVSCPSTLNRTPSNPIDIPYKGNASWTIREEAAELELEENKYNLATWRMYHLINDARRFSKTNNLKALPSFPSLPNLPQPVPVVEDEVCVFKMEI